MQNLCEFEALYRPEIQCVLKTLVSQEILASIGFKKICFEITKILDVGNVTYIFVYNFANVLMKPGQKV